jgi:CBS domain-containing protein
VADFMTPGCVVISEAASVADAARAMAKHRIHAILVVGAKNGTPLAGSLIAACSPGSGATAPWRTRPRRSPSR